MEDGRWERSPRFPMGLMVVVPAPPRRIGFFNPALLCGVLYVTVTEHNVGPPLCRLAGNQELIVVWSSLLAGGGSSCGFSSRSHNVSVPASPRAIMSLGALTCASAIGRARVAPRPRFCHTQAELPKLL